jgi:Putative zinc-finger
VTHLGDRISALVDGELGHDARDRALAHVAHCASCRTALEGERAVKDRLAAAAVPPPSPELTARLLALAEPGGPMPPRNRPMPLAPVVPTLPAPGRGPRFGAPGSRVDRSRPSARPRPARRTRHVAVGVASAAGLMLAMAFVAGAPAPPAGAPVAPPSAELSAEHAATTSVLPLSDPAFDAVTASFGGLTFPGAPAR